MIANNKAVRKATNVLCDGGHREGSRKHAKVRESCTILEVARRHWKIKENMPSRSTEAYA